MSSTMPLPKRTEPLPHQLFARAWATKPPITTRTGVVAGVLRALQRRLHAALTAWRHWRQLRATRLALAGLDAATLRDIGIVRTEIDSLAAEVHGGVAVTRARLLSRGERIAH